VLITFTKPIDTKGTKRQRILKHFGTWDDEDMSLPAASAQTSLRAKFAAGYHVSVGLNFIELGKKAR
jgi:hypothetical protein